MTSRARAGRTSPPTRWIACSRGSACGTERARGSCSRDRKSTRLNSSHSQISYAVFCLKKKKKTIQHQYDQTLYLPGSERQLTCMTLAHLTALFCDPPAAACLHASRIRHSRTTLYGKET